MLEKKNCGQTTDIVYEMCLGALLNCLKMLSTPF